MYYVILFPDFEYTFARQATYIPNKTPFETTLKECKKTQTKAASGAFLKRFFQYSLKEKSEAKVLFKKETH
jgi:hypothetical protein